MGARYFPVCFGWESFLMLGDSVGLREEMRMLRESRVCNSPTSSLFGHAKRPRRGALLCQWLCMSRRRDGPKPAGKRRQPSRQPKRGEREEGVRPYIPSQALHPQPGSPRVLITSLHYQSILSYMQNRLMPIRGTFKATLGPRDSVCSYHPGIIPLS